MTRSPCIATACALAVTLLGAAIAAVARADEPTTFARVVVDTTFLRSGPGSTYRRVYVAHRGDVFPVRERGTTGYWFGVELPDGATGWVLGAHVYNHEVDAEAAARGRFLPWLFAPPPLASATGEVAVQAGTLLPAFGFFVARPTILLHPTIGFGSDLGISVSPRGQVFFVDGHVVLNVFPRSPIVPFLVASGGAAVSSPNADSFVLARGTLGHVSAGGGLRLGFRYRLVVRLEVREHIFFSPNRYVRQEEISGGFSVFF